MPDRTERTEPNELTAEQLRIIGFLLPAWGEGLTLAYDIATALGLSPRGVGQKLAALEKLGLLRRCVVRDPPSIRGSRLYAWELTDEGTRLGLEALGPSADAP